MGLKPLYPNRWLGAKRELNPIDCIELCIWKQQPEPCRVRTVVPSQRPRYFLAAVSLGAAASLLMLSFFGAASLAMLSFFGAESLAMLSFAAASLAAFSFCAFFLALRCSCFDALSEDMEASFFVSAFASVFAGAVAGAGVDGAGVCAAAVSETAKALAISADINLFMNSSSVSLWKE